LAELISKIYTKTNDYESAYKTFDQLLKNPKYANDYPTKARIYNGLAKIAYTQGDYKKSIKYMELNMNYYDRDFKSMYMGNLGRIYLKAGDFENAKKHLIASLTNFESPSTINTIKKQLSLSIVFGFFNETKKAFDLLSQVDVDYLKKNYPFDHCVYYEYKGHIEFLHALNTGDKSCIKKALKTLHHALKLAVDFTVDGTCEGQTCRLLAEVYLHQKDYEKAREYATRAFRISRLINERYEVGVTYWIFGRLAEIDNDPKRAEFNYHMSKKILTDIGAKYELERLHDTPVAVE
jgi:tetratricopeptide (TPR) repeat protein